MFKPMNIKTDGLRYDYYNVSVTPLLIRLYNIRPLIQRTIHNISLNDEIFSYIFDSRPYRQYYINSIRTDISNSTIHGVQGINSVNGKNGKSIFYHSYYNIYLAHLTRDRYRYDEGHIGDTLYVSKLPGETNTLQKTFNNLSYEFKNKADNTVSYFDLKTFSNNVINNNFGKLNVDSNIDYGFATQLNIITGGYNQYDIISNFINIYDYANNRRGEPKYLYSYENDLIESRRLFDSLFKDYSMFYNNSFKQSDIITSYVFNYFHKFNISCASIYNKILFPNIIYNSSVLRNYLSTLATNIGPIEFSDESTDQIFKFLKNINIKGVDVFSLINDWKYNVVFGERKANETYMSFNKDYTDKSSQMFIININCTPSLINKYFTKLLNSISPKCNDMNNVISFDYKNSLVTSLYNTPFMVEFNHINLVNTIIYSILRILKTTSYYDPVTDTDYTYSNTVLLEPFAE